MSNNREDAVESDNEYSKAREYFKEKEEIRKKRDKNHKIILCVIILILLGIVFWQYSQNTKTTPAPQVLVPCPVIPTPKSPVPPEPSPWEEKPPAIISDSAGNPLAKVVVYTITNQYQWKLKNSQAIENISQPTQDIPFSSIVNAKLIAQLEQSDAIIAVGMASEEGVDKNPEAQRELATQRTQFLADYIKTQQNHGFVAQMAMD